MQLIAKRKVKESIQGEFFLFYHERKSIFRGDYFRNLKHSLCVRRRIEVLCHPLAGFPLEILHERSLGRSSVGASTISPVVHRQDKEYSYGKSQ